MTKPVAKSLHTVTVILQIARIAPFASGGTPEACIAYAMDTLGLSGRDDPYNLAGAALRQLTRGVL